MSFDDLLVVLGAILFFLAFSFWGFWKIRKVRLKKFIGEYFLAFFYVITILIFAFAFFMNKAHYNDTLMEANFSGYCPIGIDHLPTPIIFQLLFIISALLLWLTGFRLPPLSKVLALSFLLIGAVFSIMVIIQVSRYADPNTNSYSDVHIDVINNIMFALMPAYNILLATILWVVALKSRKKIIEQNHYKNAVLHTLNAFAVKVYRHPYWLLPLTFPVFIIVTLLLMVLGQDWDSSIKVFTETTCWRFSQMSHPDWMPHQGHYLCTVAARGNPKLVKPLRLGIRHGQGIVVNRQLLIANAFEELVQDFSPRLHHWLRAIYDKCGLSLSKYINTPWRSSITYVLMKPLEWLFLIALYLFCLNPEKKIAKQYQPTNLVEGS